MRQQAKTIRLFTMISIALLLICQQIKAQLSNVHQPGYYGLNTATQEDPTIDLSLVGNTYQTSKLKNNSGETLTVPKMNIRVASLALTVVTNQKILGANYGANVWFTGVTTRIEGNIAEPNGAFGFTDMYFQPLQLGWHKKRVDFTAGFSTYIPTGKYSFNAPDNKGLGMWGYELSAGATIYFDTSQNWNFSSLVFYAAHSQKRGTDVRVGNVATMEGGLCRSFTTKEKEGMEPLAFNAGLVYYIQFKITSDAIPIGNRIFTGSKDHIYALGAEANMYYPRWRASVMVKWLGELAAKNRFEGHSFFISIGRELKSLVKEPK